MSVEARYRSLVDTLHHNAQLTGALRLLEWDQETFMPQGCGDGRAEQIGVLSSVLHERQTAPSFLALVDELAADIDVLDPDHAADVRESKWRLDRIRTLPGALVQERATLHAQARSTWITARQDDDFATLAPYLERIVAIEKQVAQAIDARRPAYDVLLEEYEPGATTAEISSVFDELRAGLQPLIERLQARLDARPLDVGALQGSFAIETQRRFNLQVATQLGFDLQRGRLDEAAHPFSTSIGNDQRITTRYAERDLRYALFSTIHETGHALYEQGLDPARLGTPCGDSCSLGIHESQSRLWENIVGRSPAFWRFFLPIAAQYFPDLAERRLEQVVVAVNEAGPSLIRTESDELTYNLHIILRFELERALIDGSLAVADLPDAWRIQMKNLLGVVPDNDREGVLQDVHWASGAIGYFPTYALGNIYAAQIYSAAVQEQGDLDASFEQGDFAPLLEWLRTKIHRHGQLYRAPELIRQATGTSATSAPLLAHLRRKLELLENA